MEDGKGSNSKSDLKDGPLRKYVQWVDKRLNYQVSPHHFFTFVGQSAPEVNVYYFAFRWVMVLLCLASSIITFSDLGNTIKKYKRDVGFYFEYFFYFSNISLTLYTVTVSFGAYIVTMIARNYKFGSPVPVTDKVDSFRKVYWRLHQIKNIVALSVSTTYWLLVHPVSNYTLDLNNILSHVTNSLITLTDWAVTGLPYNFSVVWIAWVYATAYICLTYIYWISGGYARPTPLEEHPVTRVLYKNCTDWDKPQQVFMCFVGFICTISMWHVIICAVNRIRVLWWKERPEDMGRQAKSTSESPERGKK